MRNRVKNPFCCPRIVQNWLMNKNSYSSLNYEQKTHTTFSKTLKLFKKVQLKKLHTHLPLLYPKFSIAIQKFCKFFIKQKIFFPRIKMQKSYFLCFKYIKNPQKPIINYMKKKFFLTQNHLNNIYFMEMFRIFAIFLYDIFRY